jgi:hypothetical protein
MFTQWSTTQLLKRMNLMTMSVEVKNIYTMEYYSTIKKNEFMKFMGKWMYLDDIILSEVSTPNHKRSYLIFIH